LEFASLQACAPSLGASLEDYLWARGTVSSRAYALKIDGRSVRCLVPWADLLNHGGQGQTSVHYAFCDGGATDADAGHKEDGFFLMRSSDTGVAPHLEVLQSYGPTKSNSALLLDYGFAVVPPLGVGDAEATLTVRLQASGASSPADTAASAEASAAHRPVQQWT